MARKSRKFQIGVSELADHRAAKVGAPRSSGKHRNTPEPISLDAEWDASWNSTWDISWAAARDAARESARLVARAAAVEATRKAALRAARMAWRNPANDLRRHAVRRASAKAGLVARSYLAGTMALAPGALRFVLAVVAWVMVHVRRIGTRLLVVVPLVVRVVRILFGWLVRSGRKVAAWGNKEAVDVRPRTRIL